MLPSFNVAPIHTCTLPVLGKKISFTPYTIEQEKLILTAAENIKPDEDVDVQEIMSNFFEVTNQCLKTEIDFADHSIVDFVYFMMQIRAKSKGEETELIFPECSNCKSSYEFSSDLLESIVIENKGVVSKIHKITDDFALEIVPVKVPYLYKLHEIDDEIDLYKATTAHSVAKVIHGTKIYDDFTPEELTDRIIKNLTKKQIADIFKTSKELTSIYIDIKSTCPHCNTENSKIYRNFLNLLK